MCHPPDWQVSPTSVPGLIESYVSPNRSAGEVVFDVSAGAPTAGRSPPVLHRALRLFRRFLPGQLTHRRTILSVFGGGLHGQRVESYLYPGGKLQAGIGRTTTGRELVGLVYGPRASFTSGSPFSAQDVFNSMISANAAGY
jgi:hypothetical protein